MKLKRGKPKTILAITIAGAVLLALLYVIFVPRPVQVDVATATTGLFQETIRADGILRSKERHVLTALASGNLERVYLKVGDTVKKGQRITIIIWDRDLEVRAPTSGVISKVYRESAGPINRGEPIVEIVDPANLEIMAELLTTDAVRLHPNGEAWIENWSNGKTLKARVTRVSKAGFTKQSALGVEEERTEVTADLIDPRANVLENFGSTFHVDVTFKISETANALKVPVGSLFRDGSDWAVYLDESGRARKRKVEVSSLGAQEASIKAGLSAGDVVLVYPGDLVKEGARIRIHANKK